MPSIAEVILDAKLSQSIACCDINNKKFLYGGAQDERLPQLLYLVRKDVEYLYSLNPADATLTDTSNYLYALCGEYALQAQYLQGNQAGTILPTPSTNMVYTSVKIPATGALVVPFAHPSINLGNTVADGTTVLEIRDAGIQEESFLLLVNGQVIQEGRNDQFSFAHTYVNNIFTLTLNLGLQSGQSPEFRYVKASVA